MQKNILTNRINTLHLSDTHGLLRPEVVEHLHDVQVKNHSLSNFDTLIKVAAERGYIKPEDIERLMAFRENPRDESWITAR